jgi:hypothetical protein
MIDLPAYPPANKLNKVRYQSWDILSALSQWGQMDWKYIQAKVEVTAKFAISHHRRQVAMRSSYQPHIYMVSSTAPQTFELLLLQYAQKLWLQRCRNVADFIEEKGTFIGQLEAAQLLRYGSCERALFMAKEFAFEKIQGNGCAVQLDEWTSAARADIVDRTCDQLLACTGLALDQYGGTRGCYSSDTIEHRFQRMAVANELFEFARARALIATITILGRPHGEPCAHRVPSFST